MVNPNIVLLSGAEHLKNEVELLNLRVFTSQKNYDDKRLFPNLDIYTRLGDLEEIISKDSVVVIQGGSYMLGGERQLMSPADFVFETIQALEVLTKPMTTKEVTHKKHEYNKLKPPKRIRLIFTFFPFSLQDKIFQTGEAPSALIVYNTLRQYIEKMGIIDLHAPPTVPWVRAGSSTGSLDLLTMTDYLIQEAIKRYELDHPIVLSPDEGGQIRTGTQGLSKSRTNSFSVEVHGEVDVKNKEVILIDDFTKSGSTLIKSKQAFLKQGAKRVISCVTHLMPLRETGETRLEELVKKLNGEFLASNTIYTQLLEKNPKIKVSCLPAIEDFLKLEKAK
jgi:hypothetical protein